MVFSSAAVTTDDMAYVGACNGRLFAIDLKTGQLAWEFKTEAAVQNAFAMVDGDGKPNPAAGGRSRFFEEGFRFGDKLFSLGAILSSPTVERGVVYFGSTDGNVYALD
jgi:outer membrane protein assembly factor BamB